MSHHNEHHVALSEKVATIPGRVHGPTYSLVQKHHVEMSAELRDLLGAFFDKLDADHSKSIDVNEAKLHWNRKYGKIQTEAMFQEVDADGDGLIDRNEWFQFWQDVLDSGYSPEDIAEEVQQMSSGEGWVGFKH